MPYYLAEIRFNTNKNSRNGEKTRKRLIFRLITLLLISSLFSASVIAVSVLAGCKPPKIDDWKAKESVIESLMELSSKISELPEEAFKDWSHASCRAKVLHIKVDAVTWQITVGAYQGGANKLRNDIRHKIEKGIVDPWKTDLINKVDYITELIESLCKDREPPTIVSVLRFPKTPNYDETVTVIAQVTDEESGVEAVILSHQISSASWINITMNLDDRLYVAEIPPQQYNSIVFYEVYAYDKADNLAISETYSYLTIDSFPPIISHIEHVPSSPNYNETVTVFANVTEPSEASGVKNVTLWYRTDSVWYFLEMVMPNGLWTATIPRQSAGVNVEFYVETHDHVGNNAKTPTYTYAVKSPQNLPPIANFSESAETVSTGEVIHFNASDSYDPDGYIQSYFWDFGDGAKIMAANALVDHAYMDDGVYIVTLTVTDNEGSTATTSSTKTVSNKPPVASFNENATIVLTGEIIRFDASSSEDSDGSIISYLWDFGDGATAVGVKVNYAYEDDGVYTVVLSVIDDDGAIASDSAIKTVSNRPPIAFFTENASIVKIGEFIHFDASESCDPDGDIVGYFWDFGDGTNSTDVTVDHGYGEAGNYTVTLTVTDDDGVSSFTSETKIVEKEEVVWPLALLTGIGLGVTVLTATLVYGFYKRRKKGRQTSIIGSKARIILYVP